MNGVIVYYSMSGNNKKLAHAVSEKTGLKAVEITETDKRTIPRIFGDIILGRRPETQPSPEVLDGCDKIILCAPVWAGTVASPLRGYLKYINKKGMSFSFLTVSGAPSNKGLSKEFKKRAGRSPEAIVECSAKDAISDMSEIKAGVFSTISAEDLTRFADIAAARLGL